MKKTYMFPATIVRVYDGDTFYVDLDLGFNTWLRNMPVRLNGINTPEIKTSNEVEKMAGQMVAEYVKELLPVGKEFMLISSDIEMIEDEVSKGKFGRILGDILLDDDTELADLLLEKKYAVEYPNKKFKREFLINIINNEEL